MSTREERKAARKKRVEKILHENDNFRREIKWAYDEVARGPICLEKHLGGSIPEHELLIYLAERDPVQFAIAVATEFARRGQMKWIGFRPRKGF